MNWAVTFRHLQTRFYGKNIFISKVVVLICIISYSLKKVELKPFFVYTDTMLYLTQNQSLFFDYCNEII